MAKAPYKELFNPSVSASYVWRCVQVQREIDRRLAQLLKTNSGRHAGIATHGNRMVAQLAFTKIPKKELDDPATPFNIVNLRSLIDASVDGSFKALVTEADKQFPNAILPTLFKNASKCGQMYVLAKPSV